jgi:RNA polymerase sigma-70 factor (ECF subfamily)
MELARVTPINADAHDPIDLVHWMVRQAQSGDADVFKGVYRTHVGRIHALCLRMSGDAQHADSLTQDVFVRAWEKLSGFREESQFSTWLHRLAINVVLQDRRSEGRRQAQEHTVENLEEYATAVIGYGRPRCAWW